MSGRRPKGKLTGARAKHEPTVKRLYCAECASTQDACRAGRSPEYSLGCGHLRMLMASERCEEVNQWGD